MHSSWRSVAVAALGVCLLLGVGGRTLFSDAATSAPGAPARLNVLFIAVDDMNTELGCYGSPVARTPHIDRLAQRGLLFRRAYTQQAVCNPSRASLMTGMRPDTLRVWDLRTHFRDTHPNVVTLPQLFKEHGYFTQGIGKIFHNWGTSQRIATDPSSWSVPQSYHYAPHFSDWYIPGKPRGTPAETQGAATQRVDVPDETYFDGRIAQEAIQALRQHRDEPFFLGVGFWKPHLPFNAPKKYWDLYDPDEIPDPMPAAAPVDVPDIALHNFKELRGYAGMPKEGRPTPEQVRHLRHGYYAAISYVDAQIGKVLRELDRLGLSDRTIVVLWSDHGFHIGEHALWAKTSNFERDARVPLIISAPGQPTAGNQTDALVELVDVYPTLADLADLPPPPALEGLSLRPLLADPNQAMRPAALTQFPRPPYYEERADVMGYSIRTPRYRYTEWRDIDSGEAVARELYDHENDAIEGINLADRPRVRDQVIELSRLLDRTVRSRPDRRRRPADAPVDAPAQTDVYVAGRDGYHTYRIPSVIATPQGTLLAFAEARRRNARDAGDIDLVLKRSTDGGATWSAMQVVGDNGPNTFGNPCPVVDRTTGTIWLLATQNLGEDSEQEIIDETAKGSRTVWMMRSKDDGRSWSAPVEITASVKRPDWTWYATGPGVGIQTSNGRLVIPANHALAGTGVHRSHVFFSDDHGATWTLGGSSVDGTNESQVVELADGRLMLNMRNHPSQRENFRAVALSRDGGRTFAEPIHDRALIEPPAQASLVVFSPASDDDRPHLLFANPASSTRERMTVKLSYDEGGTWPVSRVLHEGPAAYASLVVLPDPSIGLLYERGEAHPYERLTFARFGLSWLTDQ